MFNQLVEQQITIKMAQCGKLPSNRPSVHRVGEELLNEVADIVAAGMKQRTLALFQEFGELSDVAGIGPDTERRQPLFNLEIVEKPRYYA